MAKKCRLTAPRRSASSRSAATKKVASNTTGQQQQQHQRSKSTAAARRQQVAPPVSSRSSQRGKVNKTITEHEGAVDNVGDVNHKELSGTTELLSPVGGHVPTSHPEPNTQQQLLSGSSETVTSQTPPESADDDDDTAAETGSQKTKSNRKHRKDAREDTNETLSKKTLTPSMAGSSVCGDNALRIAITCGENSAQLYLGVRIASRERCRDKCVLFNGTWMTPNEFQSVSGRSAAKDWKRTIKHGGQCVKTLLAQGILTIEGLAAGCLCQLCTQKDTPIHSQPTAEPPTFKMTSPSSVTLQTRDIISSVDNEPATQAVTTARDSTTASAPAASKSTTKRPTKQEPNSFQENNSGKNKKKKKKKKTVEVVELIATASMKQVTQTLCDVDQKLQENDIPSVDQMRSVKNNIEQEENVQQHLRKVVTCVDQHSTDSDTVVVETSKQLTVTENTDSVKASKFTHLDQIIAELKRSKKKKIEQGTDTAADNTETNQSYVSSCAQNTSSYSRHLTSTTTDTTMKVKDSVCRSSHNMPDVKTMTSSSVPYVPSGTIPANFPGFYGLSPAQLASLSPTFQMCPPPYIFMGFPLHPQLLQTYNPAAAAAAAAAAASPASAAHNKPIGSKKRKLDLTQRYADCKPTQQTMPFIDNGSDLSMVRGQGSRDVLLRNGGQFDECGALDLSSKKLKPK